MARVRLRLDCVQWAELTSLYGELFLSSWTGLPPRFRGFTIEGCLYTLAHLKRWRGVLSSRQEEL